MLRAFFHKLWCWKKIDSWRRLEYPDVYTVIYVCKCGWKHYVNGTN